MEIEMRISGLLMPSVAVWFLATSAACTSNRLRYADGESPFGDVVISGDQIDAQHVPNAWEALRQLVPRYNYTEDRAGRALAISGHRGRSSIWLTNSESPVVIVDGVRLASLDVLQQMSTDAIDRIELRRGSRGTTFEGTDAGAGVIYIHTRYGSE
jgi:outer membrane cobalamin receptor